MGEGWHQASSDTLRISLIQAWLLSLTSRHLASIQSLSKRAWIAAGVKKHLGGSRTALMYLRICCSEGIMAKDKAQFDDSAEAPEEVADFSSSQTSLVNIVQHRLHETPSLVP